MRNTGPGLEKPEFSILRESSVRCPIPHQADRKCGERGARPVYPTIAANQTFGWPHLPQIPTVPTRKLHEQASSIPRRTRRSLRRAYTRLVENTLNCRPQRCSSRLGLYNSSLPRSPISPDGTRPGFPFAFSSCQLDADRPPPDVSALLRLWTPKDASRSSAT